MSHPPTSNPKISPACLLRFYLFLNPHLRDPSRHKSYIRVRAGGEYSPLSTIAIYTCSDFPHSSRARRDDGGNDERQDFSRTMTLSPSFLLSPRMMSIAPTPTTLLIRQIWADPTSTSGDLPHTCTPFRLSSGGEINIGRGTIITLTQDAGFQPLCGSTPVPLPVDPLQPGADLSVLDHQDPFYSSTSPQLYAISAVTVVSYMLVIILFITPRTFFLGGARGGGGFLGQRGMISGAYGSNSVIGIGSRPWLQKLAAITVAISMTIVTADTFRWAELQYDAGYQDATELTEKVISSLEVRVVRTLSETCLWLAQAQTLIRLFPRHKEKLMIKWIAFALIILELIFSALNHFFVEDSTHRPKRFVDAIPAMNYLFALTLNLCYGGFIIFYALQKRRFAFYHSHMRNMPLVALLSLTAVLIPVVFFVLDLSKPNVAGWGSYVRWVGAAAASVVVWEWVERIEALERDEKKDGILGREIFDGDEMLNATPSSDASWPSSRRKARAGKRSSSYGVGLSTGWSRVAARARRLGRSRLPLLQRKHSEPEAAIHSTGKPAGSTQSRQINEPADIPSPPLPVASPVSRADTTSAGSTVYVVRYHPTNDPTPPITEDVDVASESDGKRQPRTQQPTDQLVESTGIVARWKNLMEGVQMIPNPFRRQRDTPPPEVVRALAARGQEPSSLPQHYPTTFLARWRKKPPEPTEAERPVIVVPAQPCRRRFSDEGDYDESSEDESGRFTERSQSPSSGDTATIDADRPPEAVLNAIRNSRLMTPSVANSEPSPLQPILSTLTQTPRLMMPEDARRPTNSPNSPTARLRHI